MFTAELKGGPRDGEVRAMKGEAEDTPVIAVIGMDSRNLDKATRDSEGTLITSQDYYNRISTRMLDNGKIVAVYAWDKENYARP